MSEIMSRETTFENAKVGDKLWSFYGREWVTVEKICSNQKYCICLVFEDNSTEACTLEGETTEGSRQDIFWDEIKFEVPVRPKQKIKKKLKRWMNVYEEGKWTGNGNHYESECQARKAATHAAVAVAIPFEVEYEEEE